MRLSEHKWYRLNETNVARLPRTPGVYELAGRATAVVFIGWAGRELEPTLRAHIKDPLNPCIARSAFFFRFELSDRPEERATELVSAYQAARYGTRPQCMEGSSSDRTRTDG